MSAAQTTRHAAAHVIAACHYLVIPYILFAWVWPNPTWLLTHIVVLPLVILQWRLNRDTCVLTNIISWLRSGRWWDESDPEQGSWLGTLFEQITGHTLTAGLINILTYSLMIVSWGISVGRLMQIDGTS